MMPGLSLLPKTVVASYGDDTGVALISPQRVPLKLQIVEDQKRNMDIINVHPTSRSWLK